MKEIKYRGYTGYVRRVNIGSLSHLCGYVILPEGHRLYGAGYDEYEDIPCHGGITFAERLFEKGFALGFDCAHACDTYNPKDEQFVINEIKGMIDYIVEKI